jgi:hypothetical protein
MQDAKPHRAGCLNVDEPELADVDVRPDSGRDEKLRSGADNFQRRVRVRDAAIEEKLPVLARTSTVADSSARNGSNTRERVGRRSSLALSVILRQSTSPPPE